VMQNSYAWSQGPNAGARMEARRLEMLELLDIGSSNELTTEWMALVRARAATGYVNEAAAAARKSLLVSMGKRDSEEESNYHGAAPHERARSMSFMLRDKLLSIVAPRSTTTSSGSHQGVGVSTSQPSSTSSSSSPARAGDSTSRGRRGRPRNSSTASRETSHDDAPRASRRRSLSFVNLLGWPLGGGSRVSTDSNVSNECDGGGSGGGSGDGDGATPRRSLFSRRRSTSAIAAEHSQDRESSGASPRRSFFSLGRRAMSDQDSPPQRINNNGSSGDGEGECAVPCPIMLAFSTCVCV
jgi:hypothetical protein